MQLVSQILSCFKISNTRLLALQCSKKLINPIRPILTKYSLFPKNTSLTSTKSPLHAENSTFFWQGHGQKYRSECIKTPFRVKNYFFFWGAGLSQTLSPLERGTPFPRTTPRPHQALWIHPTSPSISARFTPLGVSRAYGSVSEATCIIVLTAVALMLECAISAGVHIGFNKHAKN